VLICFPPRGNFSISFRVPYPARAGPPYSPLPSPPRPPANHFSRGHAASSSFPNPTAPDAPAAASARSCSLDRFVDLARHSSLRRSHFRGANASPPYSHARFHPQRSGSRSPGISRALHAAPPPPLRPARAAAGARRLQRLPVR
jgi:hypothetical protein